MRTDEHTIKIHKWLYPLSWLYGIGIVVRNKLFDWGTLQSRSFELPVICIGNLSVGGTGKTPHTEYLIRLLKDRYKTAVLSRGYKRHTRGFVLATSDSSAKTIGDEPYQMYSKFPDVTIAVDENRCQGIERLMEQKDPWVEVILLDDAFQHRHVKPGLNILLTDYNRLLCEDKLLPAGRLREPISGKNRAHIVIVTKCPTTIKPIDFNIIAKRLNLYPYQQLFFSSLHYGSLQAVFPEIVKEEKRKMALSTLKETEVLLVTGIASPAPMVKKLKKTTKHIDSLLFGDHHDFSHADIEEINRRFNELKGEKKLIVTTEKDATRLINHSALNEEVKPFIYALPIEIEILQNQNNSFNHLINDYVRENKRNSSVSEKADAHKS